MRTLRRFAALAALGFAPAMAQADIVHAYVLVAAKGLDQDAILASIADPGMCKWVPIGTINTDEPGISHTFIRFDCEGEESLSALLVQLGSSTDGISRVSVLESFGRE